VVGRSGRDAVRKHVPSLRRELALDLVVVNAENAAAGFGWSPPGGWQVRCQVVAFPRPSDAAIVRSVVPLLMLPPGAAGGDPAGPDDPAPPPCSRNRRGSRWRRRTGRPRVARSLVAADAFNDASYTYDTGLLVLGPGKSTLAAWTIAAIAVT
jgi:hypothetical protein